MLFQQRWAAELPVLISCSQAEGEEEGARNILPAAILASAVETLNQIASSVAANARFTQSAGRAQVFVTRANS